MSDFNKPIKNDKVPTTITWNRDMFARFKRHYNHAVETKRETFVFDGNGFLVTYAKYLIDVLDKEFP